MRDPMKFYFIDKIQAVASTKRQAIESRKLVESGKFEGNSHLKEFFTTRNPDPNPPDNNAYNLGNLKDRINKDVAGKYYNKPVVGNYRSRQVKRAKNYQFEKQLTAEIDKSVQSAANVLMDQNIQIATNKDTIIQQDLDEQRTRIQERLKERSKASFNRSLAKSYSNSNLFRDVGTSGLRTMDDRSENMSTKNILANLHLDDNEEMKQNLMRLQIHEKEEEAN